MPDLKPITALGGNSSRTATHGAFILEENTNLALVSLALRRGSAKPAPFGLSLPEPGLWVSNNIISALWTAPGQWLLEAPARAESDFAVEVAAACPGCSVTEQTDGFVAFEICSTAGDAPILALMTKLVNLDVASFNPGHATRTGFEHMSAFIIRRTANRLAVIGMRSAAGTIWHALETAVARLA